MPSGCRDLSALWVPGIRPLPVAPMHCDDFILSWGTCSSAPLHSVCKAARRVAQRPCEPGIRAGMPSVIATDCVSAVGRRRRHYCTDQLLAPGIAHVQAHIPSNAAARTSISALGLNILARLSYMSHHLASSALTSSLLSIIIDPPKQITCTHGGPEVDIQANCNASANLSRVL